MNPAMHNNFEVFKRRGIWLRYFLEYSGLDIKWELPQKTPGHCRRKLCIRFEQP
jgi:hypothetical protein